MPRCPYCSRAGDCGHLLLVVDKTFRTAGGGALFRAFNDRWNKIREDGGDDFDEREAFESLLDEIDACADSSVDYEHEGGPGMSSSYSIHYVESADAAKDAGACFPNGDEE